MYGQYKKLQVITIILIVTSLLLSTSFLKDSFTLRQKVISLKTIQNNNAYLSKTLVQIGKERAITSLYLGSNGKEFSAPLKEQRTKTDSTFAELKQSLIYKNIGFIPALLKMLGEEDYIDDAKYNVLLSNLKEISTIRKKVDTQSEEFKKIFFEEYTKKLATPTLDAILEIKNFALNTEISSLISSLFQLSIAKENAGLERGFVTYYMKKRASMSFEEIALWDHFKTKANGFEIKQVSDSDLRAKLENIFNDPEAQGILIELGETSAAIQTDVNDGDYAEDPMDLFGLQTKKIALLSKAELLTSSALWKKSEAKYKEANSFFLFSILTLLFCLTLGYMTYLIIRKPENNNEDTRNTNNKNEKDDVKQYPKEETMISIIAMLSIIAKSDGVISQAEAEIIIQSIDKFIITAREDGLDDSQLSALRKKLVGYHKKVKEDNTSIALFAQKLISSAYNFKIQIMQELIFIATIDGFTVKKKYLIYEISKILNLDPSIIKKLLDDIVGKEKKYNKQEQEGKREKKRENDPYTILGCSTGDSDGTIRKKYRSLIKKFHPDFLGKEQNKDSIKKATKKVQEINNAYDRIKKERGI